MLDLINGEVVGILLFFIGLWGLIARRNVIKSIISIGIMQTAVILFFLSENASSELIAPILTSSDSGRYADPLPQALMITEIVIGAGITAAALVMFIHLFHKHGSTNWYTLRDKKAQKRKRNK
ncbi:MAG: cation:proton antiporter subunit C [Lachnospiraceae bacterium]